MRVAFSGIPSSKMRNITGRGANCATLYAEATPRVASERNLRHEIARIANTGNYLIGEGARYAVTGCETQYIPAPWLSGDKGPEVLEYLNSNFDFLVFSTANIFHVKNDTTQIT